MTNPLAWGKVRAVGIASTGEDVTYGQRPVRQPPRSHARVRILASTEDDFRKLRHAWSIIRKHGPESVFVFTGLEHGLAMTPDEIQWADDELAPAVYHDRLKALTLQHL